MGLLTIKTVAQLSGVNAHTLRAWERRYGALKPSRSESGQRSYSLKDVEHIKTLKLLTEKGYAIGQIASLEAAALQDLLVRSQISAAASPDAPPPASEDHRRLAAQLPEMLKDLDGFQWQSLNEKLVHARLSEGAREFLFAVVIPLLQRVGTLYQRGHISISQEHALSALLRDHMGQIVLGLGAQNTLRRPAVALTTPQGQFHEFGIFIAYALCLIHGRQAHFFGANMPAPALAEALNVLPVSHLVLGLADLPEDCDSLPLGDYLQELQGRLQERPTVVVGGTSEKPQVSGVELQWFASLQDFERVLLEAV